ALYCTLDSATGRLRFARAGHPNPLHIHRDGDHVEMLTVSEPNAGTLALGLLPGIRYHTTDVSLSPGDRALLFTDGIVEVEDPDGRVFSTEGLLECLRRNLGNEDRLLDLIESDVRLFAGGREFKDDVCLVME